MWIVLENYFFTANALSNTWDFTVPGDYTLSTSTWSEITWGLWALNKRFEHIWSVTNNVTLNAVYDVVVDGNYAYLTSNANSTDMVTVVDISDPNNPSIADSLLDDGTTVFLDWASEIIKDWNYLYVASQQSDAVQIIDASDPTNLLAAAVVENSPTSNELNGARWLALNGDYLYVSAQSDRAIVTIDVSTPTLPVVVDTDVRDTELRGTRSLEIVWDYIFATSYNRDRLTSLDITDPANPVYTDSETNAALDRAWFVAADTNYAYVSTHTNNSVEVLDISDPTNITYSNSIPDGGSFLFNNVRDLNLSGDTLFVTSLTQHDHKSSMVQEG